MTSEIPVKLDNENPGTEVEEGNSSGKETSGETPDELEMSQFTEIQLSAESANYSTENFLESSNDTHHNNSIIQPETQSEASFSTERRTWLLCFICLELASGEKLSCCKNFVCYMCFKLHVETQISGGIFDVSCPFCDKSVKHTDLLDCLDDKTKKVLARLLLIANLKKNEKLCPRCDFLEKVTPNKTKPQSSEASLDVICSQCGLNWCFYCHSPSHKGKNCKEYQRPDNTFSEWRATLDTDWNPNAQKCPKCQINIQRDGGCTHMKCTRCKTDFCYKCGRAFKGGVVYRMLVGDHYDKYSIVGCPTLLYPESRIKRNAVRIMVYSAKKLVLLPCFIVVGVLVLAVLPFLVISFLPILLFMSSAKICCKAQTQEQIVPA